MFLSVVNKPAVPEYCFHQYLWAYFKEQQGADRPFIYRVMGDKILMLSRIRPACDAICLADRIKTGQAYQFDVLCSPVRGTWRDENRQRKRREPYKTNDERLQWIVRRFGDAADVRFAQVFDRPLRKFKKGDGHVVVLNECIIRGVVHVKDRPLFIDTLLSGIGGRGCWGHGLLLLPEVMAWKP
jgi:CRISPR-associated protein Cas6/Cse3/CasE subtype I-E